MRDGRWNEGVNGDWERGSYVVVGGGKEGNKVLSLRYLQTIFRPSFPPFLSLFPPQKIPDKTRIKSE